MGGCRDGMAVVLRQWDTAVMELRSFGGKRTLQGWNGGRFEARGGCSDGMAIIWRQEKASGMEWRSFGVNGRLQ